VAAGHIGAAAARAVRFRAVVSSPALTQD